MKALLFDPERRAALVGIIKGGVGAVVGIPLMFRHAFAMGKRDHPQGIQKMEGDVRINGTPAKIGAVVKPGDTVATGPGSSVVFVSGDSVCLVRENSRVVVENEGGATDQAINLFRMLNGKMLSVFGKGRKRVLTATATIGVRGTALYVEAESERTYACACYGLVDIRSQKGTQETVRTRYHDSPRYVYPSEIRSVKDPRPNHSDGELIMLESLAGRRPPFLRQPESAQDEGGGNGGY